MNPQLLTFIIFITWLAILLIWDLYLYLDSKPRNSITQVTIDYSKKYPIIPFLWGFLIGHFYG